MRKNNAFRRAAALLAALSITVSLAAPAFAKDYYLDDGDITITKNENGSQTVQQGSSAAENIGADEEIIISNSRPTRSLESDLEGPAAEDSGFGPVVEDNYQPAQPESTEEPEGADQPESAEEPKSADQHESAEQAAPGFLEKTITVINKAVDKVLNLTLKDVKIDVSGTGSSATGAEGNAALSVEGSGNVEIELDGNNELKSGVRKAGLEKTSTGTLTLKDDNQKVGSLTATGGEYGAGIGGSVNANGEKITITGGTVTATGGDNGAGIGGGWNGNGKDITITGGSVTAVGGSSGAGIGGGWNYNGENITITGGVVNATGGGDGAGIGGGDQGNGKDITITGGSVTAAGGGSGAGIGGGDGSNGRGGEGENITINSGTVTATGGSSGAGIGGGSFGNGKNITINDGVVNAAGGNGGAGIGGGVTGNGSNVTVSGAAQVTTTAGNSANGYGAGATIGNGGNKNGSDPVDGDEIQADIDNLLPDYNLLLGYIHHISPKREWWERKWFELEPSHPTPQPTPNAPAEEDYGFNVDTLKGTPQPTLDLHVETLEGAPLPFNARQQGSTLRVTTDHLSARLHGTRHALETLQEHGVEQIQFVTTFKTTTLSVAELLAEGGSWFALEHDSLVSRQLSAAQAESLKCQLR